MRWALVLFVGGPLFAQQTRQLTLEQALQLALQQNPAVAAARKEVDAAEARIKEARSAYYPQTGFNGIAKAGLSGATNGLGLVGLPNSPFYRNFADSLNIYQNGFDFGRTAHNVALERKGRESAEADLDTVRASVRLQTERAFYSLLRAHRLEDAARQLVTTREYTLRQATAFYEGQLRSRVDVDLAQAGLARARRDLLKTMNEVRGAEADLDRALGITQPLSYDLQSPVLTVPKREPLSSTVEGAYRLRPELRSEKAERGVAEERVQIARSERRPLLGFVFSSGYARFSTLLARELTASGAGLLLPLFTGGRLEGQIEEAQAELAAVSSREELLKEQILYEVRAAWLKLQDAIDSLPVLDSEVAATRSAVRLASERYRERLGSAVELNAAEAALAEALATQAGGAIEVKLAEAQVRFAEGRE
jgi:outer membrane protein TolC